MAMATGPDEKIYAGTKGGGVFWSSEYGDSWSSMNTGLTSLNVYALVAVSVNGELFAGTEGGVFNFDGISWYDYSYGLLNTNIRALGHSDWCYALFAGTVGGGVWFSPYPIGIDETGDESNITVIPNPVKDFLTIRLTNQEQNQEYAVEFYSIDGRLVSKMETLMDMEPITVADLNPGIYLIRLSNQSVVLISKFIKE
jgi:hypothetical protein